jgi:hypothetical protein
MTTGPQRSYRYPWPVSSPDELAREMAKAQHDHGRLNVCGWLCAWLPDPKRVVKWAEAKQIVAEAGKAAEK